MRRFNCAESGDMDASCDVAQASCGNRTDQPQAVRIRPGGKLFHHLNRCLDNLEDACVILHV